MLMEVKANMCRVLLTVSDLRLDFRVTKMLNLFKISIRDMKRAQQEGADGGGRVLAPHTQEKMSKYLLMEEKQLTGADGDNHSDGHLFKLKRKTRKEIADMFTNEDAKLLDLDRMSPHTQMVPVLLDMLMYEHPGLFEAALKLLVRRYQQKRSLLRACDPEKLTLLDSSSIAVFTDLQGLKVAARKLKMEVNSWEIWGVSNEFGRGEPKTLVAVLEAIQKCTKLCTTPLLLKSELAGADATPSKASRGGRFGFGSGKQKNSGGGRKKAAGKWEESGVEMGVVNPLAETAEELLEGGLTHADEHHHDAHVFEHQNLLLAFGVAQTLFLAAAIPFDHILHHGEKEAEELAMSDPPFDGQAKMAIQRKIDAQTDYEAMRQVVRQALLALEAIVHHNHTAQDQYFEELGPVLAYIRLMMRTRDEVARQSGGRKAPLEPGSIIVRGAALITAIFRGNEGLASKCPHDIINTFAQLVERNLQSDPHYAAGEEMHTHFMHAHTLMHTHTCTHAHALIHSLRRRVRGPF
jgi:hypothetical protein